MKRKFHTLFILMALFINANALPRYAEHSKLAAGKWVKIRVKNEGVYQLTSAALQSMGFSNPDKVSLYGYNLPFLPEANIENLDDDLTEIPLYRKKNGTILFYSCGTIEWKRKDAESPYKHRNNPYSNYVYYFLTESAGTPASFTQKEATGSAIRNAQTTYYTHTLHEQDAYSFLNTGRTFFEQYDYATGNTKTYNLPLDNTSCGDITLDIQFGAAGNSSSTVSVSTGSNTLGMLAFTKLANYQYASVSSKSYTLYDQTASALSITLKHTRASGISGHLDYIRASYEAQLSLAGKSHLIFSPNSNSTKAFTLQGASATTSIWNVTHPNQTHELKGKLEGNTFNVTVSETRFTDKYVAVNTNATFPSPENVGQIENQDLHALDSINLLIIVPANGKLTAQAQRLADAHTLKDGIKCAVVEADKIYNEFSSGTPDATAYRRLMKMLHDKQYTTSSLTSAQKGSFNLLLFGNCFWDNRLITSGLASKSQDDYLLAYESDNSWSHTDSYVMEEYFTLLADGKGISPLKEKPDCGVGRIPVTTATEAKTVVDKLITYMYNIHAGAWKNTICMMGDDGNDNIHMEDAENVLVNTQKLFPDYHYKRIYWDSYTRQQSSTGSGYPDAYAAINKVMQEGALIMNYTGHGAPYTLSHEQVLKTADFQKWDSPNLPLWLTAACDVAPFDMNTANLACEALLNKQGAAMGFIGTARTVYSSPNRTINRYFMSHVLANKNNGERYTIGEALSQAKADILGSKTYFSKLDTINKAHFVLLGDPAIKLITPTHKIKIDKVNGKDVNADNKPNISAGETVTIEGHIVDATGQATNNFNGVISPIVYDNEQHIVCKNNPGDDVEPFEYNDRTRTLYAGADSVRDGRFTFTFPVPLDINYSDEPGLIILHAINNDKSVEAQGLFEDFLIGGTYNEEQTDTVGPTIATYSDGHNTGDISITTTTPTIRITLYDDNGINTTGNGLGHDIVAIIDGKESMTYTLNSYYSQAVGDYRSGTVEYTLPTLPAGKHTLVVRAFDTLNNMGEGRYIFEAVEGLEKEYDLFDTAGRKIGNTDDTTSLPKGIYIKRLRLNSPQGVVYTKSEKIIIIQ